MDYFFTQLVQNSDYHGITCQLSTLHPEDLQVTHLPVNPAPWAPQSAWMGKPDVFGHPWWRASAFNAVLAITASLAVCSRRISCSELQAILWQNAKDTEMLNSMMVQAEGVLSFLSISTQPSIQPCIDEPVYRHRTERCTKNQWRLKKWHFPNCFNHHYHSFYHSMDFWAHKTEPGLDPLEAKPFKSRSTTSNNHQDYW